MTSRSFAALARAQHAKGAQKGKATSRALPSQRSLVLGHHEGDLVMGSAASNSAVGTIVERTPAYSPCSRCPQGMTPPASPTPSSSTSAPCPVVHQDPHLGPRQITGPAPAHHRRHRNRRLLRDLYAPWQRGSNENTNGLLREYLLKGTDLSAWPPAQLQAIAAELNDRPRKRLGYHTPREAFA